MSDYSKPTDLIVHEWTVCDSGLARYDTLAFNFRSWAIAVYGAALAAAVVAGGPLASYIPLVVLVLVAACWWADGLYRTLQDHYMSRATVIQQELRASLAAAEPDEYIRRFLQAEPWIGPSFAAVPPPLRDKKAIVHMAWQPHIRWFYLPLLLIALFAWIIDPARPDFNLESPRLWIALAMLVPAWLGIRAVRSSVDKWRSEDAKKKDEDRETRIREFSQAPSPP